MCGILGFVDRSFHLTKNEGDFALNSLQSRGPDSTSSTFKKNEKFCYYLGHKRLSIIDLSSAGNQPMMTNDGRYTLVYNGEIYNFLELKKKLTSKGVYFKGTSDSEVLLQAFALWGSEIAAELSGMFAYGIFDAQDACFHLARDHFGKKPVYYFISNDIFAFASEQKALLALRPIRDIVTVDSTSLTKYLYYGYVPAPHGIFKQIKKLEPATSLKFNVREWCIEGPTRFWKLSANTMMEFNSRSERENVEHLEFLIDEAVSRRVNSDVPLGLFLSGGLDSSLIARSLARHSKEFKVMNVRYPDSPEINEDNEARYVTENLGLDLSVVSLDGRGVSESFTEILDYLDEPMADIAIVPLYHLSKIARETITVALTGDGGDEVFGGYPKYRAQALIESLGLLRRLGTPLRHLFRSDSPYFKFFSSLSMNFVERQFIFGSGGFLPNEVFSLTGQKQDLNEVFLDATQVNEASTFEDPVNQSMYLDCRIQLPEWYLVKSDRATMAASLEARSPFLDKDIVEYAFSLHGRWKIKNGEGKYLLKKVAERYFNRDFVYRQKKGFAVPLSKWINSEHKELFSEYLFRKSEYFSYPMVKRLYDDHVSGRVRNEFKLYRVFAFNYWRERYGGG